MNVQELIDELKKYNPFAEVGVVVANKSYPFSMTFGGGEGCTKEKCESVHFYVDELSSVEAIIVEDTIRNLENMH